MAEHRDTINRDWIILAVFGDYDPLQAAYGNEPMGDEDPRSPVEKAMDAARLAVALGKSTENLGWDEELGSSPAAAPAKPFAKSSEERFAKTCAKLKTIFGDGEDYEAAVQLAKAIRDEAVAEIVANF
jgi:hypothetical protein